MSPLKVLVQVEQGPAGQGDREHVCTLLPLCGVNGGVTSDTTVTRVTSDTAVIDGSDK